MRVIVLEEEDELTPEVQDFLDRKFPGAEIEVIYEAHTPERNSQVENELFNDCNTHYVWQSVFANHGGCILRRFLSKPHPGQEDACYHSLSNNALITLMSHLADNEPEYLKEMIRWVCRCKVYEYDILGKRFRSQIIFDTYDARFIYANTIEFGSASL